MHSSMYTPYSTNYDYKKYNNFAIFGHFISAVTMAGLLINKKPVIVPFTETYSSYIETPINVSCPIGSRSFDTSEGDFCISTVTSPVYCDDDYCYGINIGLLIISFHALSFVFQLSAELTNSCGPILYYKYDDMIASNKNPLRFIEYSISASIMLIAIAVLNGVTDINLLISIAVLTASCQLCGLAVEFIHERSIKVLLHCIGWLQFCWAYGIIFHAFFRSISSANDSGNIGPPSFVYVIVIVLFLLYASFGFVQLVEVIQDGDFNRYTKEKCYVVLSLTAKLILGWMIFSNVLVLSN